MPRRCDPQRESYRRATSVMTWCAIVLTLAGPLPADELRFDAQRLLERGQPRDVRLALDGAGVELERGVLVEDDGPAAGYSYQPNEETLNVDTWIAKKLVIADPRAAQATLLVGPGGELVCTVSGSRSVRIGTGLSTECILCWKPVTRPESCACAAIRKPLDSRRITRA